MPIVIDQTTDTTTLVEQKKHLLEEIECGAVVTVLALIAAIYTGSPIVMLFAGLFVLAESFNAYDYVCLCKRKDKSKE